MSEEIYEYHSDSDTTPGGIVVTVYSDGDAEIRAPYVRMPSEERRKLAAAIDPEVANLREKVAWYSDRDRGLVASLKSETNARFLAEDEAASLRAENEQQRATLAAHVPCQACAWMLPRAPEGHEEPPVVRGALDAQEKAEQESTSLRVQLAEATARAERAERELLAYREVHEKGPTDAAMLAMANPAPVGENRSSPPPGFGVGHDEDGEWWWEHGSATASGFRRCEEAVSDAWVHVDTITAPARERAAEAERTAKAHESNARTWSHLHAEVIRERAAAIDAARDEGRREGWDGAAGYVESFLAPDARVLRQRSDLLQMLVKDLRDLARDDGPPASPKAAPEPEFAPIEAREGEWTIGGTALGDAQGPVPESPAAPPQPADPWNMAEHPAVASARDVYEGDERVQAALDYVHSFMVHDKVGRDMQRDHALALLSWAVDTAATGRPAADQRRLMWALGWVRDDAATKAKAAAPLQGERDALVRAALAYVEEVDGSGSSNAAAAAWARLRDAAKDYAATPTAPQGPEPGRLDALADEVLGIVHAFPDEGRRDAVRKLAQRIRAAASPHGGAEPAWDRHEPAPGYVVSEKPSPLGRWRWEAAAPETFDAWAGQCSSREAAVGETWLHFEHVRSLPPPAPAPHGGDAGPLTMDEHDNPRIHPLNAASVPVWKVKLAAAVLESERKREPRSSLLSAVLEMMPRDYHVVHVATEGARPICVGVAGVPACGTGRYASVAPADTPQCVSCPYCLALIVAKPYKPQPAPRPHQAAASPLPKGGPDAPGIVNEPMEWGTPKAGGPTEPVDESGPCPACGARDKLVGERDGKALCLGCGHEWTPGGTLVPGGPST
jgi:hypothetical protein